MQDTIALTSSSSRGTHVKLWVTQGLLAAVFLLSGAMKLTAPLDQLRAQMPWVSGAIGGAVRFIGLVEVLGAVGVVLPAATRVMPKLTPLAAAGLAAVMVLASLTHASRGEFGMIPVNLVLGGMAAFVAWEHARKKPIAARA